MLNRVITRVFLVFMSVYLVLLSAVCLIVASSWINQAFGEDRIPIAVIDTGVKYGLFESYLCHEGHRDLTGRGLEDATGHGSNIVAIISRYINPETHCIIMIKWIHDERQFKRQTKMKKDMVVSDAIRVAIESGAKYINMSLEGDAVEQEKRDIEIAVMKHIHVVVAAGNHSKDLGVVCSTFPACYPINSHYFHVVASYKYGIKSYFSNFNGPVTDKENGESVEGGGVVMSGTSQATAIATGKLVRSESAHLQSPFLR